MITSLLLKNLTLSTDRPSVSELEEVWILDDVDLVASGLL